MGRLTVADGVVASAVGTAERLPGRFTLPSFASLLFR